mmetsp:Transcript_55357/g.160692  ORF Transcript_55357/g.160692 Transcript_55357/m.160692 type:complete len:417 (+) Transcript_55357:72-1322(+)
MRTSKLGKKYYFLASVLVVNNQCDAFLPPTFGFRPRSPGTKFRSTSIDEFKSTSSDQGYQDESIVVQAPLKYLGPYAAIGLRFPNLATSAQRARNVTGVSLDFVLDTAANVNTINGQVAQELLLEIVGEALPGVGSSGAISGGHTYELGDAELERGIILPETLDDEIKESFLFMQNLTASALPVASPASAGLLSLAFLSCFDGGVEFYWGSSPNTMKDGLLVDQPTIKFFAEKDAFANEAIQGLCKVPIKSIPVTQLPSVLLNVNGVQIPALLDTGSPVTVFNSEAAKQAGIETVSLDSSSSSKKSNNPFAAVANRFKEAQELAKANADGKILTIAGMNGPVNLFKSVETIDISAVGDNNDMVSFGQGHIYVGDIPGLAALNGIGVDAPPAIVLGMDVLRRKPKMVLRARDNEVYF